MGRRSSSSRSSSSRPTQTTQAVITATVTLTEQSDGDPDGTPLISSLVVHGHEIDPTNSFQLCTALSMLVRTLLHLIQRVDGVEARIEIPHEGSAVVREISVRAHLRVWFGGVSALFLQGIGDLAAQFPQKLTLTIERAGAADR